MVEPGTEEEASSQYDPTVLMEELIDHLKLLDYEDKFVATKGFKPLDRAQFSVAGRNPSEQFIYFTALASWLLSVNGSQASFNKYDDPSTVANSVIVELQKIGIQLNFPPNKLRAGHGEGPCLVLLSLAKAALKAKRFKFKKPVFPQDGELQGEEILDDDDDDAEIIDEAIDSDEGEAAFAEDNVPKVGPLKDQDDQPDENAPIWSSVDPQDWMLEVERVGPRLKLTGDTSDLREWRAHLEQTRKYGQKVSKEMPELEATLQSVADALSKQLEQVSSQEKKINTSMPEITGDFRNQANELNTAKTKFKQTNERVAELSNQLKQIDEQIQKISSKIDKQGKMVTDSTPLVAVKEGLKSLKAESKDMELRTAVLSHALFQAKLKEKSSNEFLAY